MTATSLGTDVSFFSELRLRAEEAQKALNKALSDVDEARGDRARAVRKYKEEWLAYFQRKCREHELTWCTGCHDVFSYSQVELVYVTGKEDRRDHGDLSALWMGFSELHRFCATCNATRAKIFRYARNVSFQKVIFSSGEYCIEGHGPIVDQEYLARDFDKPREDVAGTIGRLLGLEPCLGIEERAIVEGWKYW